LLPCLFWLFVDDYRSLLHCIAENPGVTADQVESQSDISGDAQTLLGRATAEGDTVCVNGRYWVVRKGEFAVAEYDHPKTEISGDSITDG
jgi:hypothetical protein